MFESVNLPNKADKPPLAKAIEKEVNDNDSTQLEFLTHKEECPITTFAILDPQHTFIIDGGSLLYRLKWDKYKTVQEFIDSYCKFVKNQCGENAVIVFNGYSDKPSTKDITHQRRSRGKQYATIHFTSEMKVKGKKEDFLSNLRNKKRFIDMLIFHLTENGITVVQAEGDADLLVVEEALKAVKSMDTVVVGEDTDILILLLFHSATESYNLSLYFRSDKDKSEMEHDINHYKKVLGNDICRSLLFLHAFTGCDSISSIFSIGKTSAFKKLIKEKDLQIIATQFLDANQNHTNNKELGEKEIKILYNYGKEKSQKQSLNI